jgi:hypothetical protein
MTGISSLEDNMPKAPTKFRSCFIGVLLGIIVLLARGCTDCENDAIWEGCKARFFSGDFLVCACGNHFALQQ